MASPAARHLTEAHRRSQARLAARTVQLMLAAWPLLDVDDLDESVRRWLQVVFPLVQVNRRTSARLAASYIATFRAVELGLVEPFTPQLAAPVVPAALTTSMMVTGPALALAAMRRGVPAGAAMDTAAAASSRAAIRHVLDGGRATITATTTADDRARGWVRVTSAKACDFCSTLAGKSSGEDAFAAHDGCHCSAEPLYT